jgi:glutamyl-tRNA synthetase
LQKNCLKTMRDIEPRFHTSEHILTAVVGELFNGLIIDSRFKENKVRCDYQVDLSISIDDFVKQIEKKANDYISKNLTVSFEEVSLSEAEKRCKLHRIPEGASSIRLVKVGEEIITPCAGAHVKNTKDIHGKIKIKNFNQIDKNTVRVMFSLEEEVRVRIAPSPTGLPHIGNIRAGFYNFLFARHHKGQFFMRIEDTDRERLVPESLPKILEMFNWLGLKYDNEPYIQSEHLENYKQIALKLVEEKKAYYCFCSEERLTKLREEQSINHQPTRYDRHCRNLTPEEVANKLKSGEKFVIRLIIPENRELSWDDLIRGKVTVNSNELDDQVLLKSDGFPTYHLAVVYDDNMMGITHVLRGMEWLPSTPKHILIYEALGYEKPYWGHMPIILGTDRSKLSKRHGAQSALEYKDQGYLPIAILNTMLFWGWSPKDNQQFFTLAEMIEKFDIDGINKNDPIIDLKKLDFFNAYYIRQKSDAELLELLYPYISDDEKKIGKEKLMEIIPLIKNRMKKLSDWKELVKGFFEKPDATITISLLAESSPRYKEILEKINSYLSDEKIWEDNDVWQTGLRKIADEFKIKHGNIFMILRIAVWGERTTPPIYEAMKVIGIEKSMKRIRQIIST